jgi:hypothetical protein
MAVPTMLEVSRTHSAVGAFGASYGVDDIGGGNTLGGQITAITNANPSVFTTTNAHGLLVGDYVQVSGVTTDTAVNGSLQVSAVGTASTFSLPVAGNGVAAGLTTATASIALPIAGVTGDWTLRLRIESAVAALNAEVALEDSVDGITWITRVAKNFKGSVAKTAMLDILELRKYDYPSFRFGTANAVMRLNVLAIDGGNTIVTTCWYES